MTLLSREDVEQYAGSVVDRLSPGLLIRTASAHLEAGPPSGGEMQISAGIELKVNRPSTLTAFPASSLLVSSRYTIEATPRGEGGHSADQNGWRCEVELHGLWNLEGAGDPTDDELRSFAARVGLLALHPYARSHIQTAVTEAAWPPFTLDVLTPATALFESAESPGMCNLDDIEVS